MSNSINLFEGFNNAKSETLAEFAALLEIISLTKPKTILVPKGDSFLSIILAHIKSATGANWLSADLEGKQFLALVKEQAKKNRNIAASANQRRFEFMLSAKLKSGIGATRQVLSKQAINIAAEYLKISKQNMSELVADKIYEKVHENIIHSVRYFYQNSSAKAQEQITQAVEQRIITASGSEKESLVKAMNTSNISGQILLDTIVSSTQPLHAKDAILAGSVLPYVLGELAWVSVLYAKDMEKEAISLFVWLSVLAHQKPFADAIYNMPSYVPEHAFDEHMKNESAFSEIINSYEEMQKEIGRLTASAEHIRLQVDGLKFSLRENENRLEELVLSKKNTEWERSELKGTGADKSASCQVAVMKKTEILHHLKSKIRELETQIDFHRAHVDHAEQELEQTNSEIAFLSNRKNETQKEFRELLLARKQHVEDMWRLAMPEMMFLDKALLTAAAVLSWDRCKIEQKLRGIILSKHPNQIQKTSFMMTNEYRCVITSCADAASSTVTVSNIEFQVVSEHDSCQNYEDGHNTLAS
jgi:hypothetical protein